MRKYIIGFVSAAIILGVAFFFFSRNNIAYLEKTNNIPRLVELLSNEGRHDIRKKVEVSLINLGAPAAEAALPLLEHESVWVRLSAVEVLGGVGAEETLEPLLTAMRLEEDYSVQQAIVVSLPSFGEAGIAELHRIIESNPFSSDHLNEAAVRALGDWEALETVDLIKIIESPSLFSDELKNEAVRVLGSKGEEALPYALDMLASGSKYWGVKILEIINDPGTEDELMELLTDERTVYPAAKLIASFHDNDGTVLLPYLEDENTYGVYKALIAVGDERTTDELVSALEIYDDEEMVEFYLNCGHPVLEGAARQWARSHGYLISEEMFSSDAVEWGSN